MPDDVGAEVARVPHGLDSRTAISMARSATLRRCWVAAAAVWMGSGASDAAAVVQLQGLDPTQERNVRAHLSLSDIGCDAPLWLVRRQYRLAESEIRAGLEALGFYGARVTPTLEVPKEGCWNALFVVEPGNPIDVEAVHVTVDEPLASKDLMRARIRAAKELEGEPLNHGAYEAYKASIATTARTLGYFDARFERATVLVDAKAGRATVTLALDAGERYRYGAIAVESEALAPELVRAYVPFKEGEPYNGADVAELRRDLNDSGYFGQVLVQADPVTTGERVVPVSIDVSAPVPRRIYTVGAGYATDTGLRLRGDVTDRLRNERGHRAGASLLISPVRSVFDANYRLPHTNPMDDWFSFDAGLTREDTDTSKTEALRAGVRHIHERGKWVETNFIDGSLEDFEIAGERSHSRLLVFGTSWTRTTAGETSRPTDGYRLTAELSGAARSLGSDNDFAQAKVNGKYVFGLTEKLRVLARAQGGWTVKDEFSDLPPSVRFFAGGDNSIRGYGYEELGPEKDGEVVGGSKLVTGSLEADYAFLERWSVAAFVDTGSAYDEDPQFSTGAGLGIRWYSPLGPIRVDIAHPFDSDDDVRLHITVGPDL